MLDSRRHGGEVSELGREVQSSAPPHWQLLHWPAEMKGGKEGREKSIPDVGKARWRLLEANVE